MRHQLLRLLKIALTYKGWMILAALLGFLTVGSSVGLMMTSAYIIAKAALHPSLAELQVAIVGVRFFGISRGVFRYLERYVSHQVTFKLLAKFRVWFYRAIEPLAPARLMKYKSGDLLSRIVSDVESLEHIYARVIAPPVVAVLVTILMWILFSMFDPLFSLLVFIFMALAGIGVPLLTRWLSRDIGTELINLRSRLNEMTVDGIQGMSDLLAFGEADRHFQQFDQLNQRYVRLQRRMSLINGMHESLIGLLMNLAVLTILFTAIPFVTQGLLDGVFLAVLTIGTMGAFEAVMPMPTAVQYLDNSMRAAQRLFEITDAKPAVQDPAGSTPQPNDTSITVKGLTFAYESGQELALENLNFELSGKQTLAVVGASGAGKSTLFNLLLRFWDYQQGEILLGSEDIRRFHQEQVRSYFAVVSQNTHLFNGSIRDNLELANPDATEADLINAARQAQIDEFIQNSPEGYDTWVGEQGFQLSGGERQRLAIARAILKNAPIMIFDEATANLDALTEQKILQTIQQLAGQKTTLIITHRLVGLENADEIIVLSAGSVVERGSHEFLLAKQGHYWHLWKQQTQILSGAPEEMIRAS